METRHFRDGLRSYCQEFGGAAAPLHRVMMVGAIPERVISGRGGSDDLVEELSCQDECHLEQTFCALKENGIAVDTDFTLEIVNLHPAYGGRDFLVETASADIVIMAWVNSENLLSHRSSPLKDIGNIWHDSAVRVGAKIVSVISYGYTEVGPSSFCSSSPESQFEIIAQNREAMLSLLKHRDFRP